MRAPPPRSWKLGRPMIPPSSPQHAVLAMAVLGGAGFLAGAAATTDDDISDKSSSATSKCGGDNVPPSSHTHTAVPHRAVHKSTIIAPKPRIPTVAMQPTQILATSHQIIATSDASAEKNASLAAAARLSTGKSSPFSVNKQEVAESTTDTTAATELKQSNDAVNMPRRAFSINKKGSKGDSNSAQEMNGNNKNNQQSTLLDDSYPTFTPYHHSLLKKYLTPTVWSKLYNRSTSYGTTIEDIIRAGLALPIGANPPRRVGVLVGDAECYTVFRELLDPIISEYHSINSYEDWMDPELPMERYFSSSFIGADGTPVVGPTLCREEHPTSEEEVGEEDYDYGVMKSSGADEDSDDDDDDCSFFIDEEDDEFIEHVALPSSLPPTPLSNAQSSSSSARHVATIASKRKASLRRHPTIINNPRLVTNREADPEGKYIVSTRIRVARSLDGMKFPTTMSRSDRRKVLRLIRECTEHFQSPNLLHGTYLPVLSMTNDQNLDLIERHILFDNPNEWTIASGLGRDWPDGRALYANVTNLQSDTPDFMIWVNEEDHLRIMCLRSGGDIQGVFTTLMNGIRELERELSKRGWHFAYDSRLGYLTSCPTNVGTTMRASVHVRLTNLGRQPGFFELVERLKLEVRGKYGETDRRYTGVFDISNAERLGKSEVHLINVMVEGVAKLIELERRMDAGEIVNIDDEMALLPKSKTM